MIRLRRVDDGYAVVSVQPPENNRPRPTKIQKVQRLAANYWDTVASPLSTNGNLENAKVLLNASSGGTTPGTFPYSGPFLLRLKETPAEYPTVIPNYSSWFDLENVHENEKRALPEFFTDQKSTERYLKHRNIMVKAFRQNPRVALTATACRKLIAGDACSILRIHNFLESWGLINYMVDPGSLPITTSPSEASDLHFPVYTHSASIGGLRLMDPKPSPNSMDIDDAKEDFSFDDILNLPAVDYGLRRGIVTGSSWKGYPLPVGEEDSHTKCHMCSRNFNGTKFICKGGPKQDGGVLRICQRCFKSGNFPVYVSSQDFEMKVENPEENDTDLGGWSKDENMRLMDALERYGDSWDTVAEYVGRSKAECVHQFVKLPIEDPYIEQYYNPLGMKNKLKDDGWLPFADTANPIMAQIAFLSSMVSPVVASAAAQTAMASIAMKQDKDGVLEKSVKTEFGIGQIVNTNPDGRLVIKLPWSTVTVSPKNVAPVSQEEIPLNLSRDNMEEIARDAFVSAVMKAEELSEKEFRQMVTAVVELIQLQMKKIELKMKHFEQMELVLSREKDHLEKCRQALFDEKVHFAQEHLKTM